jgi:hypothetical protein
MSEDYRVSEYFLVRCVQRTKFSNKGWEKVRVVVTLFFIEMS